MIIIFIFIILLVLIVLKYLSAINIINKNIPLIFTCILLMTIPFLYLARRNNTEESFGNIGETLDIYYTNEKKEKQCDCPGICDKEKNDYRNVSKYIEMIDSPEKTIINEKNINSVTVSIFSGSNTQGSGFKVELKNSFNDIKTISENDNGIYIFSLFINNLLDFSNNDNDDILKNVKKFNPTSKINSLINYLNNVENNSYIIVGTSGGKLNMLIDNSTNDINELKNKYKFKIIDQLQNGDSYAAIIFKKNEDTYIDIQQEISKKKSNLGVFLNDVNLLTPGVSFEVIKKGQIIDNEKINKVDNFSNTPFVKYSYVYIKPVNTNKDFSLVFTVEKTDSFVYLTDRKENDIPIYSEDTSIEKGKGIKTFLNLKQPQKWTFDPVYTSVFTDTFFIRTYDNPVYYLDVNTDGSEPKLVVSLYKSGGNTHWKIIKYNEDKKTYIIQNEKTKLYLGYNNFGGYLYNDSGSVDLVESNKFNWKFVGSSQIKKNWLLNREKYHFKDFSSPNDYPTVDDPKFILKTKNTQFELSGRSPWSMYYTPIWKGDWVYYGTIATYNRGKTYDKVDFLKVIINDNGEGYLIDPYFKIKIKIRNAGSNILFGNITSGKFNGYLAVLEMAPINLDYKNPKEGYPVRMRYLLINNKNEIINLSSGNVKNLNSYCVKYDGKVPAISSYLDMTGSTTYVNEEKGIGFPKQ